MNGVLEVAIPKRLRDDDESGPSREYTLEGDEDPADGLRRAATGRLEDALEQLQEASGGDSVTAVHETRKDLKKTRSILRLVRDRIGDDVYRRENGRFREVAQFLAGTRDAQVKLETLKALAERYPADVPDGEWESFAAALEAEADADPDADRIERGRQEIVAGINAIEAWPLGPGDWELVSPGVERSYRRGRRHFAEVADEPSEEAVHEWRKRVKDLWYHLRLLEQSWAPVLGETADQVHELSDLLGDHHDLAVLGDDACSRPQLLGAAELDPLTALIERRQEELLDQALERAERIYAEKPKRFRRRLERYWDAWS